MNFINRTLVVLQLLFAIPLAIALIALLVIFPKPFSDFLTNLVRGLPSAPGFTPSTAICAGLAAVTILIALLMLFLELQRPAVQRLKVQQVMGGDAEITADAIVHRLEQAILQIPDITKVRPHISAAKKGNMVDLFLEVETAPDVNVPQKTQEVLAVARSVTDEKMGLKAGKIQVRLDHARKIKNKKDKGDAGRESQSQLPPPQQPQIPG